MKVELIVDRIEGDQVVLIFPDNTSAVWPKNKLDGDVKEGQTIYFNITNSLGNESDQETPKQILNEILNTD